MSKDVMMADDGNDWGVQRVSGAGSTFSDIPRSLGLYDVVHAGSVY